MDGLYHVASYWRTGGREFPSPAVRRNVSALRASEEWLGACRIPGPHGPGYFLSPLRDWSSLGLKSQTEHYGEPNRDQLRLSL